jgi:hypothetical protein
VKKIVNSAVENNLVLHAHCDEEALKILFSHNPRARIIWAHTGFTAPLSKVEEYLKKYAELSYSGDVSDSGKLNAEWRALFTKYSGSFLVGSDTWVMQRWRNYPEIMGLYRRWLGELPGAVALRIAWNDGAQLFGVELLPPAVERDHTDGARWLMMNVTCGREFPVCCVHCVPRTLRRGLE